jgi:hypothetical protein
MIGDLADIGQRAEQRQTAIADVIAAGAIVDEADHLVAELTVLQDAIRDHPSKFAGAGNQDSLQADAGFPAAFQHLAHGFARRVAEDDGEDQEDDPDPVRDFVGADRLRMARGVVGADVQRRELAEDDGDDAADQDGEEIVDAGAPAAQAIDALDLEGERREQRDERQDVQIVAERRLPLRRRNQSALEPDAVRQYECP